MADFFGELMGNMAVGGMVVMWLQEEDETTLKLKVSSAAQSLTSEQINTLMQHAHDQAMNAAAGGDSETRERAQAIMSTLSQFVSQ